jgi:hypothetical protein
VIYFIASDIGTAKSLGLSVGDEFSGLFVMATILKVSWGELGKRWEEAQLYPRGRTRRYKGAS